MKSFLGKTNLGLDIDVFDQHSKHFGLYVGTKPAGYVRLVMNEKNYFNKTVEECLGINSKLICRAKKHTNKASYPFLGYRNIPPEVSIFYQEISEQGSLLIEGSRFMLFEGYKGIRKAKFLFECSLSICLTTLSIEDYAIINCAENHESFYKKYGFISINSKAIYYPQKEKKVRAKLLSLPLDSISENYFSIIHRMKEQYTFNNQIRLVS